MLGFQYHLNFNGVVEGDGSKDNYYKMFVLLTNTESQWGFRTIDFQCCLQLFRTEFRFGH